MTIAVLLITAATLSYVVPTPADIRIDSHDEMETPDLIFYVVPQPAEPAVPQIPRDILFGLHIAVSNMGGRKAVLSSVKLMDFLDETGNTLSLPDLPMPLHAERSAFARRYVANGEALEVVVDPGPWMLEPDDVITLRFRFRRGIDWSERWGLEELRRIHDGYTTPIHSVNLQAMYRRGRTAERRTFRIPIKVEQQRLYIRRLEEVTANLTVRPALPLLPFDLE